MAFISDLILDLPLTYIQTDGDRLYICSQEPTTFTEATATYDLGVKTALSIGAPGNGTPNGRKVTVAAITDGSVTDTGTATHWAIVDFGDSELMITGQLAASQAVTSGNTFTLAAFDIRFPDAVNA